MTGLLLLLSTLAMAQDGAKVFQQSCAVGYCHGSGGSANRAPKLVGRSFEKAFLERVVRKGVPNTAMPGFQGKLPEADVAAVVNYVLALGSGVAAAPTAAPAATPVSSAAPNLPGKELFFDAIRGTRCGTCHALEGMGTAVGPNLAGANATADRIGGVEARHVRTASTAGDRFPALVVENKGGWVKLYDLTTTPPVLRTIAFSELRLSDGNWRHSSAIAGYDSRELELIAGYIRSLGGR